MRTGKAKQHYLLTKVTNYIRWRTRRDEERSQSAFVNKKFLEIMAADEEYQQLMKTADS